MLGDFGNGATGNQSRQCCCLDLLGVCHWGSPKPEGGRDEDEGRSVVVAGNAVHLEPSVDVISRSIVPGAGHGAGTDSQCAVALSAGDASDVSSVLSQSSWQGNKKPGTAIAALVTLQIRRWEYPPSVCSGLLDGYVGQVVQGDVRPPVKTAFPPIRCVASTGGNSRSAVGRCAPRCPGALPCGLRCHRPRATRRFRPRWPRSPAFREAGARRKS